MKHELFPKMSNKNASVCKKKKVSVPLFLPSMQMLVDTIKGIGFSHAKMHSAEDEAREVDRQEIPLALWPLGRGKLV